MKELFLGEVWIIFKGGWFMPDKPHKYTTVLVWGNDIIDADEKLTKWAYEYMSKSGYPKFTTTLTPAIL